MFIDVKKELQTFHDEHFDFNELFDILVISSKYQTKMKDESASNANILPVAFVHYLIEAEHSHELNFFRIRKNFAFFSSRLKICGKLEYNKCI